MEDRASLLVEVFLPWDEAGVAGVSEQVVVVGPTEVGNLGE